MINKVLYKCFERLRETERDAQVRSRIYTRTKKDVDSLAGKQYIGWNGHCADLTTQQNGNSRASEPEGRVQK